jgi:hypothetical protein
MKRPKAIRVRRGALELATWHYEHPHTRRRVVLIGMMHVANPTFYERVRETIDKLGRPYVLLEGVGRPTDPEVEGLNEPETRIHTVLSTLLKHTDVIADMLGEASQRESFRLAGLRWRRGDMQYVDVVRLLAANPVLGESRVIERLSEHLKEHGIKEDDGTQLRWLRRHPRVLQMLHGWVDRFEIMRAFSSVILDERNHYALVRADALAQVGDVVLPWGAGHLPGLHGLLVREGYDRVREDWLVAQPRQTKREQQARAAAQSSD